MKAYLQFYDAVNKIQVAPIAASMDARTGMRAEEAVDAVVLETSPPEGWARGASLEVSTGSPTVTVTPGSSTGVSSTLDVL